MMHYMVCYSCAHPDIHAFKQGSPLCQTLIPCLNQLYRNPCTWENVRWLHAKGGVTVVLKHGRAILDYLTIFECDVCCFLVLV